MFWKHASQWGLPCLPRVPFRVFLRALLRTLRTLSRVLFDCCSSFIKLLFTLFSVCVLSCSSSCSLSYFAWRCQSLACSFHNRQSPYRNGIRCHRSQQRNIKLSQMQAWQPMFGLEHQQWRSLHGQLPGHRKSDTGNENSWAFYFALWANVLVGLSRHCYLQSLPMQLCCSPRKWHTPNIAMPLPPTQLVDMLYGVCLLGAWGMGGFGCAWLLS